MKIQVMERELTVTLFRKRDTVVVVLEAGAWLPHNRAVLKKAAGTIMTDVLMPIARHGELMEVYARTTDGLFEVQCDWAGCEVTDVLVTRVHEKHPRAEAITKGFVERGAFIQMRNWLHRELPEHCA